MDLRRWVAQLAVIANATDRDTDDVLRSIVVRFEKEIGGRPDALESLRAEFLANVAETPRGRMIVSFISARSKAHANPLAKPFGF